MFVPPLGLRHVEDQVIWNAPTLIPWPSPSGLPVSCRFKNDNTLEGTLAMGSGGLLAIDNARNVDHVYLSFVGEISASQGLLSGQESSLEVAVLGVPVLGDLKLQLLFAAHPGESQVVQGSKVGWWADGLGLVAGNPGSLPAFHGHQGTTVLGNPATKTGWPFYGDVDGNVNGFWAIGFPLGKLANPSLSLSGYRKLFVEVRCRLAGNEDVAPMQLRGMWVASLFEYPADQTGLRRG